MIVETNVEVRYQETDQMGVVYHANYLVWFEIGRTTFMKEVGFPYYRMEEEGIVAPVLDIQVQYKKPLTYGQVANVKTWVKEYNGVKITYEYEITNENGELAVTGQSTHVCVKKGSFRPIALRKKFPALHDAYLNAVKDES